MTYLYAWLLLATVGQLVLYIGYGFAMSAVSARNKNASSKVVLTIDCAIAACFILLDAAIDFFVMPVLCLDLRAKGWLHYIKLWGRDIPVPELVTERMRLYYVDPNEGRYRKWIANQYAKALDGKDPKGWHISDPSALREKDNKTAPV